MLMQPLRFAIHAGIREGYALKLTDHIVLCYARAFSPLGLRSFDCCGDMREVPDLVRLPVSVRRRVPCSGSGLRRIQIYEVFSDEGRLLRRELLHVMTSLTQIVCMVFKISIERLNSWQISVS